MKLGSVVSGNSSDGDVVDETTSTRAHKIKKKGSIFFWCGSRRLFKNITNLSPRYIGKQNLFKFSTKMTNEFAYDHVKVREYFDRKKREKLEVITIHFRSPPHGSKMGTMSRFVVDMLNSDIDEIILFPVRKTTGGKWLRMIYADLSDMDPEKHAIQKENNEEKEGSIILRNGKMISYSVAPKTEEELFASPRMLEILSGKPESSTRKYIFIMEMNFR